MDMYLQFAIDMSIFLLYALVLLWTCFIVFRLYLIYKDTVTMLETQAKTIMLEIKLPRIINKSPVSFDMVSAMFTQGGGVGTAYNTFWKGAKPATFSLEIESREGTLHFYIRTQSKFKDLITSNLYAHYPGIEIVEAPDYTKRHYYHHRSKDVSIWALQYSLSGSTTIGKRIKHSGKKDGKEDMDSSLMTFQDPNIVGARDLDGMSDSAKEEYYKKIQTTVDKNKESITDATVSANVLPIKTYVDYGLDKNPEEEYKNDPLIPILESMASIGKGEFFWYQIILQDESVHNDKKFAKLFKAEILDESKFAKEFANKTEKYTFKDLALARIKWIRSSPNISFKGQLVDDELGGIKEKEYSYKDKEESDKLDKDGKPIMKDVTKKVTGYMMYIKNMYKNTPTKDADLTIDSKDEIEAINAKINKPLLRAVIRTVYGADKRYGGNYNSNMVQATLSLLKNYSGSASFGLGLLSGPYDYEWENVRGRRNPWRAEEIFEGYVEREAFFPHIQPGDDNYKQMTKWEDQFFYPYNSRARKIWRLMYMAIFDPFYHPEAKNTFVLNTEEVASLYHFPGEAAQIPGLPRIDSVKGSMPTNLPTEL